MARHVSDLSKDFIINGKDRPDGMRSPGPGAIWDFEEACSDNEFSKGLVARDLELQPVGSAGAADPEAFIKEVPLIPREYWNELIEEQERKKTRLSDFMMIGGKNGQMIEAHDQNGQGYCWAYSTAAAIELQRAKMGLEYVRLSPHSLACRQMNFQDRGGWCGLSASKAIDWGYVPAEIWPERSMDRRYNTDEAWEAAQDYRLTEGFLDLHVSAWDMNLAFDAVVSCLLSGIPCPVDFNWWSHSICGMDVVAVTDRFPVTDIRCWGLRIRNSWRTSWGVRGTGVIVAQKAIPMGAVAVRNVVGA